MLFHNLNTMKKAQMKHIFKDKYFYRLNISGKTHPRDSVGVPSFSPFQSSESKGFDRKGQLTKYPFVKLIANWI